MVIIVVVKVVGLVILVVAAPEMVFVVAACSITLLKEVSAPPRGKKAVVQLKFKDGVSQKNIFPELGIYGW